MHLGGQVLEYISAGLPANRCGGLHPAKGEFSTQKQGKQGKKQNTFFICDLRFLPAAPFGGDDFFV
jgi:hypothetical protein